MADDRESVMGDGTADRGEQFTAPNRPVMSGPMLIIDRSIDRPTGQSPFFAPRARGPYPLYQTVDPAKMQISLERQKDGPKVARISQAMSGGSGRQQQRKNSRAKCFGDPSRVNRVFPVVPYYSRLLYRRDVCTSIINLLLFVRRPYRTSEEGKK